ncbi:MAG: hypothetical protein Q8O66_00660, partial [bacterium]|nr:hypothetical protein [bacterium]
IIEEIKNRFLNVKIFSNITVIVTTITIIIIIALSFLYYYYGVLLTPVSDFSDVTVNIPPKTETPENPTFPQPSEDPQLPEILPPPQLPEGEYTKIISYFPPAVLPSVIKEGKCLLNSIAHPYRQDTWRCVAENKVYDPCFAIQEDKVICQMNPLVDSDIFLIKLTNPLLPKITKDNWAWFLDFEDGTYCAPYTGKRPQVQGEEVYYGCKAKTGLETIVILGELKKGVKWTARTAVLIKQGLEWRIKSVKELEVKTAWQ